MWAATGCSSGTDSIDPPGDPIGFTFESAAGSFASFGWTGAVHNVIEPPGTPFGVKTTECRDGVCRFEGPTDPGGNVNRRRCLFRMSKTCNIDSDCPLRPDGVNPTPCVYIYDPPIATPLVGDSKIGACAWSYIPIAAAGQPPTITGTLNLASGALNLENLTALLPLNANVGSNGLSNGSYRGPCAECVDDTMPNDGVREGTCRLATHRGAGVYPPGISPAEPDPSPDIGMPCDVNRTGTIGGYDGNYSMDCSPTVVASVSPPLQFGGSFTSSGFQVSITEQSPDCTTPGHKCFCAMCPDNVTACMSNADCGGQKCAAPTEMACKPNPVRDLLDPNYDPGLQVNQCKNDPTKFAVFGDNCSDECAWDPMKGVGTCKSKQDGSMIGCYPSDLDARIIAPGRAKRADHIGTVYEADTANARCIPARSTPEWAPSNSQLGLPGLLFQKRNFQIIPTYAEDKK